jgi:hypothetical protein
MKKLSLRGSRFLNFGNFLKKFSYIVDNLEREKNYIFGARQFRVVRRNSFRCQPSISAVTEMTYKITAKPYSLQSHVLLSGFSSIYSARTFCSVRRGA